MSNIVSEIKTLFRFCPQCGRRFHIKLVSKKLVNLQRETVESKTAVPIMGSRFGSMGSPAPIIVQTGEPVTIDVEEFQYAYRCKHCGHEWSEKRVEESKE